MLLFTQTRPPTVECDAVVVGSGFGGSMAAHELRRAGATMWRCGFSRKSDEVLCTAVTAPPFAPSPPSGAARAA